MEKNYILIGDIGVTNSRLKIIDKNISLILEVNYSS